MVPVPPIDRPPAPAPDETITAPFAAETVPLFCRAGTASVRLPSVDTTPPVEMVSACCVDSPLCEPEPAKLSVPLTTGALAADVVVTVIGLVKLLAVTV